MRPGLLSNGYYHGQVNTTNRLFHPEVRMQKYLQRFLEWPITGREPAFAADPEDADCDPEVAAARHEHDEPVHRPGADRGGLQVSPKNV